MVGHELVRKLARRLVDEGKAQYRTDPKYLGEVFCGLGLPRHTNWAAAYLALRREEVEYGALAGDHEFADAAE